MRSDPDSACATYPEYLNTPRLIADSSGTPVWKWDQAEPFGVNTPDENPSSLRAFEFPIRFPGQYADRETNLAYNMLRDYDPAVARYIESDLIGLRGGLNTYAYASSPLTHIDPYGLMGRGPSGTSIRYVHRPRSVCGTGALTGPEFSFKEACQSHDDCYSTCGANRYVCDAKFTFDTYGSCRPGDWLCVGLAATYQSFVVIFGGSAYADAQRAACVGGGCGK